MKQGYGVIGESIQLANIKNTLMQLRKVVNHPYLIQGVED
jgi:SNF2 family DNA or RNA helicase